MRVRGLKLSNPFRVFTHRATSHPMRVRGLKRYECEYEIQDDEVAPHAGAWIETGELPPFGRAIHVAPHAGAWIETYITTQGNVRGGVVAPHAGAWIETELVNRVG